MNDQKQSNDLKVFVVTDGDMVHGFVPSLEHAQGLVLALAEAEREKGNTSPLLFEVREITPEEAAKLLIDSAAKCRADDALMAFVPENGQVN